MHPLPYLRVWIFHLHHQHYPSPHPSCLLHSPDDGALRVRRPLSQQFTHPIYGCGVESGNHLRVPGADEATLDTLETGKVDQEQVQLPFSVTRLGHLVVE